MNEKIIEKLKNPDFFKELVIISDESKVKEAFKKDGIDITDNDLEDMRNFIKISLDTVSELSEEELKQASGGYNDGIVNNLSDKLSDVLPMGSWGYENSDKIVEGCLAAMLVGGTLGVQKLIKVGKEKGWWTKKYWTKKKK